MSGYMGRELVLLARSCWCGALLLFFYDCLRIFRNVIPHRPWAAALEDLLFGTGSGIWLCVQVFRANSGALRGYFLVGMVLGIAAWHFSLSGIFVEKLTAILRVPIKKILILLKWLKFYARRGRISLYRLVKTVIQKIGNCFGNGEAGGPNGYKYRGDRHGRQEKSRKKKKKTGRGKAGGAEQGGDGRHQHCGHHAAGGTSDTGAVSAEEDSGELAEKRGTAG